MKVLTIWILPIMVRSGHLQIRSFCFMVLISSSKFHFCFNRLSYVKCTPSILTNFLKTISLWKLIQFNALIWAQLPSNIISVFSSFIVSPEHFPKRSTTSKNCAKAWLFLTKPVRSSANNPSLLLVIHRNTLNVLITTYADAQHG